MAKSALQSPNTSPKKPSSDIETPALSDELVVAPVSKRKAAAKAARNAGIGTAIVLLLLVGAGVAYTWYMGQQPVATITPEPIVEPVPVIKPVAPAENASVGASVQSLTTPLTPGMNANIIIHTHQYATCTIVVEYNKVASTDSGLKPKKADEFGTVSWTWTVEESVPVGKWPVKVTCVFGERSIFVQGDLDVVASLEE